MEFHGNGYHQIGSGSDYHNCQDTPDFIEFPHNSARV
jgi:hypothetical protein